MPIACHDDNLTDKEKAIVNEKINEEYENSSNRPRLCWYAIGC